MNDRVSYRVSSGSAGAAVWGLLDDQTNIKNELEAVDSLQHKIKNINLILFNTFSLIETLQWTS